jgi:hypothetical protein
MLKMFIAALVQFSGWLFIVKGDEFALSYPMIGDKP